MEQTSAEIWIAARAHRLQQRWRALDTVVLEGVASIDDFVALRHGGRLDHRGLLGSLKRVGNAADKE